MQALARTLRAIRFSTRAACVCSAVLAAQLAHAAPGDVPPARFSDPARRARLLQALPAIEALMAERQREMRLPALAYAVVIDGEVVLARGSGQRSVDPDAPADVHSVFRIASMTKSFTALAVLKLRDAGRLNLDDPVSRHVPELRGWPLPTSDSAPITVRQLLGHLGGLPEDNPQGDRTLAYSDAQLSTWLQRGVPLASGSGSQFEYSNLGFVLLGRVITQVAGRPYQAYISDEILKPLGMQATVWSPSAVPAGRLVQGYHRDGDALLAEPILDDGAGGAMGGLFTTAADLSRWVAMMLAAWPPRDGADTAPALRRTLREMQMGQGSPWLWVGRRPGSDAVTGVAGSYGFGLGAAVDCLWGRELSHGGGLPGYGSHMRWLPDHGVGVLALANLRYAGAGRLTRDMLNLLHATGALKPRQAQASPALQQAARAAAELVIDWRDDAARALAAENLFLDEPLEARRAGISKLKSGLQDCKPGALEAENALRGRQRVDCDGGWLDVTLTLAPTQPPGVQWLEVSRGGPASAAQPPPSAGFCTP